MKTRRILSAAAALVISASMFAVPASATAVTTGEATAAEGSTTCTFKKVLESNKANAKVPVVTFKFTIAAGKAVDEKIEEGKVTSPAILAGIGTPSITNASFGAADDDAFTDTDKFTISKDVTVDFTGVTFPAAGIYRYVVTETADDGSVQGITNDTTTERYLDVYVENGDSGTKIAYYVLHDTADAPAVSEDEDNIIATYTGKSEGFENKYDVYDLTLTKEVTGNQGDKTKDFTFIVSITNAKGASVTAKKGSDAAAAVTLDENGAGTYEVTLKNGESTVISGLPKSAKYEITESDNTGYTVTAAAKGDEDGTFADSKFTDNAITDDTTVTFTNKKDGIIPTGVMLSVAGPAVIGLVVAGGIVTLSVKRKKRNEED